MPRFQSAALRHRRNLVVVLFLVSGYLLLAFATSLVTGSLSLLAEAGHMLTDAGSLALTLFAIWFAQRPATPRKTYGYYRAEILAALANGMVLLGVSGFILYEAYKRAQMPPHVDALPVVVVAGIGLVVNGASVLLLREGAGESLNVQGVFLEVLGDALGTLAVLVGAALMLATGVLLIDPILSVLIALLILPRTWRLMNRALNVLLEGTPAHISIAEVRQVMLAVEGVYDVHDLHVWTITPGLEALSAHLMVRDVSSPRRLLETMNQLLRERFSIDHLTLQVEEEWLRESHIAE